MAWKVAAVILGATTLGLFGLYGYMAQQVGRYLRVLEAERQR